MRSASGLEPREVLEEISAVAHELMARQARVFTNDVRPALAEAKTVFASPAAKVFLDFIAAAKRGVCSDPGKHSLSEEE